MEPSNTGEYVLDAIKASPPVAAAATTLAGYSLNDWMVICTIVYTLLQLAWFVYDKYRQLKAANGSK